MWEWARWEWFVFWEFYAAPVGAVFILLLVMIMVFGSFWRHGRNVYADSMRESMELDALQKILSMRDGNDR